MKRRKSEKTFYWRWCWVWQLPGSKNKLLMAGRQDADAGTCQGQTAQVAAALVERAWRPQGVRTSMTGNGLRFSAGSLLKQDLCASPPLWAGSQSTQKRRWCYPLNHPRLVSRSGEGGAHQRALGTTKGCLLRMSREDHPMAKERRLRRGEGWMGELPAWRINITLRLLDSWEKLVCLQKARVPCTVGIWQKKSESGQDYIENDLDEKKW